MSGWGVIVGMYAVTCIFIVIYCACVIAKQAGADQEKGGEDV